MFGKKEIINQKISNDINYIEKLLEETDEAYRYILKNTRPLISNISDIEGELNILRVGGVLVPKKILEIKKILSTSRYLKNLFSKDENINFTNLKEICSNLSIHYDLEKDIDISIISENEISDEASNDLKRIRRQIKIKNENIRDKINHLISTSDKLMDNIYTMRDGRYVVPVKSEFKNIFKGIVHDQSSSGQTVYIEPLFVVELNNELKKLEIDEQKEIEKIIKIFSQRVYEILPEIVMCINTIAYIDMVFAKGKFAIDYDCVKPILNTNGILNIKSARHPLIDQKIVVPIDIRLGENFNTLVITGPNTGGKTVTLKTIGILVLMNQFGMLIPCSEKSEISVFDNIFADIGDEQSIEQSLSTFSSHMKNIIEIINSVTPNSLVLFDELGSGTDPEEGSGLSISILNYFIEKNIRTVATTHYSQLKIYAMSTKNVENAAMEFDVDKLSPTYKLIIGISGKSNAFEISRKLGLDNIFIENAKKYISNRDKSFDNLVSDIEAKRKEYENILTTQNELLEKNKIMIQEYKKKSENYDLIKEKKLNAFTEYIDNILNETSKFCKDAIDEINKSKLQSNSSKIREIQNNINTKIEEFRNKYSKKNETYINSNEDFILGEEVKILSLNETGYIQTLPDKKGNLQIKVGIIKVSSNINDIIRIENLHSNKKDNKLDIDNLSFRKVNHEYSSEIDVRGLNSEEAIYEIDKFIDDSIIARLNVVTIIHGRGTGKLRNKVIEYLKTHKMVKSYNFAKINQGGDGATIVNLK